jgi:hypothetical protein
MTKALAISRNFPLQKRRTVPSPPVPRSQNLVDSPRRLNIVDSLRPFADRANRFPIILPLTAQAAISAEGPAAREKDLFPMGLIPRSSAAALLFRI